jgi:hypothetical protein
VPLREDFKLTQYPPQSSLGGQITGNADGIEDAEPRSRDEVN